jgi:hypothetical protein
MPSQDQSPDRCVKQVALDAALKVLAVKTRNDPTVYTMDVVANNTIEIAKKFEDYLNS